LRKMLTQFFQGAGDALLRGIISDALGLADGAEVLFLIKTEDEDVVIRFAQFGHGVVEHGPELTPIEFGIRSGIVLFHGLPFTGALAVLVAAEVERDVPDAATEPAGERGVFGQAR